MEKAADPPGGDELAIGLQCQSPGHVADRKVGPDGAAGAERIPRRAVTCRTIVQATIGVAAENDEVIVAVANSGVAHCDDLAVRLNHYVESSLESGAKLFDDETASTEAGIEVAGRIVTGQQPRLILRTGNAGCPRDDDFAVRLQHRRRGAPKQARSKVRGHAPAYSKRCV